MGFLDSLFGGMEGSTKLTPQEAFAGVLLGASACDGHIADEELNSLATALVRMKLYQRYNNRQFNDTLNKLLGYLKKHGVDSLIDNCVEHLPGQLSKTAFANACDIVMADGVIEQDEKEFINKLRSKLSLDSKLAKSIARVMVTKNKG